MQNNFEPINLKNAQRHLDWLINKNSEKNKNSKNNKPQKIKISLWGKILNVLTKIF